MMATTTDPKTGKAPAARPSCMTCDHPPIRLFVELVAGVESGAPAPFLAAQVAALGQLGYVLKAIPRPNLADECEARRNCRFNLGGLRCVYRDNERVIRGSMWDADSDLTVGFEGEVGPETYVKAADVVLLDRWRFACCRGPLDEMGQPRARKRKRGGR